MKERKTERQKEKKKDGERGIRKKKLYILKCELRSSIYCCPRNVIGSFDIPKIFRSSTLRKPIATKMALKKFLFLKSKSK